MNVLATEHVKPRGMWLFERLVFGWFIFNAVYYFGARDIFWGGESIFMIPNYTQGLVNNFFYILIYSRQYADFIFFVHLASAVLAFFGIGRFFTKILVWATSLMLYYAAWSLFNSGFLLCVLYSFYLAFAHTRSNKQSWISLTNVALIACMLQLTLVYAEAAAFKMSGSMWWEGSAFYYAINLEQFTSLSTREFFNNKVWLVTTLTYVGLAYQALFPIAIWIKKIKWLFLALGLLFHLFIAIFMGLPDFGSAMIIGYVLFIPERKWKELYSRIGLERRFEIQERKQ